ncbi:MAG: hypothetical protein ABW136_04070, partial [Steroidobacteraceae bacterium]
MAAKRGKALPRKAVGARRDRTRAPARSRRGGGRRNGAWRRAWGAFRRSPTNVQWVFGLVLLTALLVAANYAVQVA